MTPAAKIQIFAIKRGNIKGKEIFCSALYPYYLTIIAKYKASCYNRGALSNFIYINPKTNVDSLKDEDIVSFVPMTAVECLTNNVAYEMMSYAKVKKGFTVFHKGDLLWAKITPCMQNGKSCIVDKMPTEIGFGSTEFHVLRAKNDSVYMPFVWALFSSKSVLKAAQAMFNGSAGQQRVYDSFFRDFPAVFPEYETQKAITDRLNKKLLAYKQKLQYAEELLSGMDEFVLNLLNLSAKDNTNKLGFAVCLEKLAGVIDVKRHLGTNKIESPLTVQNIADVIRTKINPQNYPEEVFDWIRIDDLPNQPADIAEVRTERGDAIEGTFFEVRPGDILVARLGPTILNRKTVMVRTIRRRTIASAEFLVLRCNEGYLPEAVMAILKTKWFIDQMYANARGSTPSRYRLNREDMLNLAFPDITDTELQNIIAREAVRRRDQALTLRSTAEREWQSAREQFEKELLGE